MQHDQERLAGLRRQAAERWHEVAAAAPGDAAAPQDAASADGAVGPADQEGIDDLARRVLDAAQEAERTALEADTAAAAVRRRHHDGSQTAARWDRRAALLAQVAELRTREPHVNELSVRLAAARQAAPLAPSLTAVDQARTRAAATEQSVRGAAGRLAELVGSSPLPLPPSFDHVATEPQVASQDLAARRAELVPLVTVAERRDQLSDQVAALLQQAQAQDAVATQQDERATATAAERERVATELQTCRTQAAGIDAVASELHRAGQAAAAATELQGARRDLQRREAVVVAARSRHLEAKEQHLAIREEYLDGIAATLATGLVDGRPCTVCGSSEHPAPATAASVATAIERSVVDELSAAQDAAAEVLERAVAAAAGAASTVAELVGRTGGCTDPDDAANRVAVLDDRLRTLTLASGRIDTLQDQVGALSASANQATSAAATAREHAVAHRSAARAMTTELDRCVTQLRTALGDDVDPAAAIRALDVVHDALATLVQAVQAHTLADRSSVEAQARLHTDLGLTGFPDADAARAAVLDDDQAARIEQVVDQHRRDLADAHALLGSDEFVDVPTDRPDTAQLQAELSAADAARTDAASAATALRGAAVAIGSWADAHRTFHVEAAGRRERSALLTRLSDTVGGRSGDRVSLKRWVLAAYLEDICALATHRLQAMTGGRYTLVVHRESTARNRLAGLDLHVIDAHTGDQRDVSTLSGGETFQASLALALAVADAVQHHSGGIRLDALFIDEGFGTLDADALELAMDELDALRAGGRMVGVISHVGTMRERIRTGIQVTPTEHGSTVRVGAVTA